LVLRQVLDTLVQLRAEIKAVVDEGQEARIRRIAERVTLSALLGVPVVSPGLGTPGEPFTGQPPKAPEEVTLPPIPRIKK
jgi:hypothetical protein